MSESVSPSAAGDPRGPEELAPLVLDAARDEAEVTFEGTDERFVRFSDRGATQSADRRKHVLAVRARLVGADGIREARATTGRLTTAGALEALARAEALAEVSAHDPELLPLGGPVEVSPSVAVPATREHGFDAKAAWVRCAGELTREAGLVPAGLALTRVTERALWNTAGRSVHGSTSRASFALYAGWPSVEDGHPGAGPGGDAGFASELAADAGGVDAEAAVRRAVEKARRSASPEAFEPGETTVVLEPDAVSSLLLFASYQGFGARAVDEEASLLCGRIGVKTLDEKVTIRDDAFDASLPGLAFDGEGSPRQVVTLVDRGVLGPPVTDDRWARKLGLANTGHAPCQPSPDGPRPDHLHLLPGDAEEAGLCDGVQDGLLVTQFHYTNVIDPRELTLTGMTRGGTFRIVNGELGPAVRNLRFTQSLVEALGRVTGLSRRARPAAALFGGEAVVPTVRIEGFRFTSATEF